jgi:hypothetical protein
MAPLRALSRFTFAFAFPSSLSSVRPVLSLYDPLVRFPLSFQLTLAIYILRLFTHISIFYNTTTLFRFTSTSAQHLGTFTLDMRALIDFSLTYLLTTSHHLASVYTVNQSLFIASQSLRDSLFFCNKLS